ncbi:hypothetical protein [Haliea sp.]|uniref:hypothetical protein n=1 Tax=Haliea sp. TaxID=1932666 RepID=UPI0025BA0191|nr:hypothetical protein [Haliea sp.]|tara:strand:+ start:4902 stop:5534 length:633 start_codon:yes stop_codon:yes gene_type:complete
MEFEQVIIHCKTLKSEVDKLGDSDGAKLKGLKARIFDFLSKAGGSNNTFLKQISSVSNSGTAYQKNVVSEVLSSFIAHMESGLVGGISPKRQAELDVVSDLLEQANSLLENAKVHPAAPAVLIGATLEEFLRTWIEEESLSLGGKKPGLDAYCKTLREQELITKQDVKDITAWSGIRNHAAHGEWSEVEDRSRIRLMLEGVNLFIRQRTA